MGFFSWLTADTQESIVNTYAASDMGVPVRTAYLLQPNGKAPIEEPAYEGYGMFGGVDANVWLAQNNLPAETLASLSEEDVRGVGICLDVGSYYVDTETGKKWAIFHNAATIIDPEMGFFPGSYDEVIPEIGMSANDLIAAGRFERKEFTPDVPLKFSFDKDAVYEDLEASNNCPDQGYFFASDDEDEEEEYEEEEEFEDEEYEDEDED